MRKINFKQLHLSYFLSTGEEVIVDYKDGIFFIRGDNQTAGQNKQNNGVGKTAIFLDGLVYALYGETSRRLKKSEIPFNKGGKRNCIVQLKFEVVDNDSTRDIKILRTINPSKFQLHVDGEDISNSNASATQEYLVKEILGGIKREVFQHSIAMKVNSTVPFMSMSKVDRDKFIGGIFDLSYLKECEKIAREEYNTCSKEVGKMEVRLNESLPNLKRTKDQIETLTEQEKRKESERNEKIFLLEREISEITLGERPEEIDFEKKEIAINEALNKLRSAKADLERKASEERMRELDLKMRKERLESEIDDLKSDMNKKVLTCSKCGHNVLEESKAKIQKEIEVKESELREL